VHIRSLFKEIINKKVLEDLCSNEVDLSFITQRKASANSKKRQKKKSACKEEEMEVCLIKRRSNMTTIKLKCKAVQTHGGHVLIVSKNAKSIGDSLMKSIDTIQTSFAYTNIGYIRSRSQLSTSTYKKSNEYSSYLLDEVSKLQLELEKRKVIGRGVVELVYDYNSRSFRKKIEVKEKRIKNIASPQRVKTKHNIKWSIWTYILLVISTSIALISVRLSTQPTIENGYFTTIFEQRNNSFNQNYLLIVLMDIRYMLVTQIGTAISKEYADKVSLANYLINGVSKVSDPNQYISYEKISEKLVEATLSYSEYLEKAYSIIRFSMQLHLLSS
jgi:hypothetical protein